MKLAPVIAGLALLTVSGPAAAQTAAPDQIADLNRICIAAGGDRTRAAELAQAAGYSPTPAGTVPERRNMRDLTTFLKSDADQARIVLIGRSTRRIGREEVTLNLCAVSAHPAEVRPLQARLRQMIGFEPVREGGGDGDTWAWLSRDGGRAPVRNLNDANATDLAATGQLRIVNLQREGQAAVLTYATAQTED